MKVKISIFRILKNIFIVFILTLTVNIGFSQNCGDTITDIRDGQTYITVQIGDQCWFAENLKIGIRIFSASSYDIQADNGIIEKYYYNNDTNTGVVNGGLYEWNEAMDYQTTIGAQGICPEGWHIPTDTDWDILENNYTPATAGTALIIPEQQEVIGKW